MPVPLHSPMRTLLAVAAAAVCLTAAAPAGAQTPQDFTLSGAQGENGWYTSSFVTGFVSWDVQRSSSPHRNGDRDEGVSRAFCYGERVTSSDFVGVEQSFNQRFTVGGPTGPRGAEVICQATFEERHWICIFGACGSLPYTYFGTFEKRTTVKIDPSPPLNVAGTPWRWPMASNWHNTPTSVDFSGLDRESGIQTCSRNVPVTGPSSTSVKFARGRCTNVAGLSTDASYTYRFDDTPPALAPTVSSERVVLGAEATATPHATDEHSGVASSSCDTPDTSTLGIHTVRCTATDVARNSASAEVTYEVVPAPSDDPEVVPELDPTPQSDPTPQPEPAGQADGTGASGDSGQAGDAGQNAPQPEQQPQQEGTPALTLSGSLGAIKGNTIKRSQLKKGYPLRVTCATDSDTAATLTVTSSVAKKLRLKVAKGQKTATIGSARSQCKATGGGTLTLKLTSSAKSKVRNSKGAIPVKLGIEYTKPGSAPFQISRSLKLT